MHASRKSCDEPRRTAHHLCHTPNPGSDGLAHRQAASRGKFAESREQNRRPGPAAHAPFPAVAAGLGVGRQPLRTAKGESDSPPDVAGGTPPDPEKFPGRTGGGFRQTGPPGSHCRLTNTAIFETRGTLSHLAEPAIPTDVPNCLP